MDLQSPSLEQWKKLYELMARVKEAGFTVTKPSRLRSIERVKRELSHFIGSRY